MPLSDGYAAEIASLEEALAVGEVTIESDGERVTYRNPADIMRGIDYFQRKAASAVGAASRPNTTVAVYSVD
jgi:hypothetical protein